MKIIIIVALFNSLLMYTLTARADSSSMDKTVCVTSDGEQLTAGEVESIVKTYVEDQPENTDLSTEIDDFMSELCE
jgi:CMP-N-acetylneuraminic acid synthetase